MVEGKDRLEQRGIFAQQGVGIQIPDRIRIHFFGDGVHIVQDGIRNISDLREPVFDLAYDLFIGQLYGVQKLALHAVGIDPVKKQADNAQSDDHESGHYQDQSAGKMLSRLNNGLMFIHIYQSPMGKGNQESASCGFLIISFTCVK